MQILFSRVCGIDVHKDMLAVCVLIYREGKKPEARYKEFAYASEGADGFRQLVECAKSDARGNGVDGRVLEAGLVCAGGSFPVAVSQSVSGEGAAGQEDG